MSQIDPQQRLTILDDPQAQECTLYRPDDNDPDAEEEDLGDARVLFAGPFEAPVEWDAAEREEFFADCDPALFVRAYIECEAKPGSKGYFVADIGDYVATLPGQGEVLMYYVHDFIEDASGRLFVLLRDEEVLD
ncbi:hypothetical protein A9179_15425 [Pseudomonas alcaligenes]|uniref:Uncharacterized protein n=1 Tax=Aquipseudomonas alcaligenes TaxID=43263 RepID=A0ABR7S2G6_AQUAC|nr:hypothetical protein [Pseudomonas alcaligenes]MBC9251663.1 hypothetical protein [Pseudomonas alcaligenes]